MDKRLFSLTLSAFLTAGLFFFSSLSSNYRSDHLSGTGSMMEVSVFTAMMFGLVGIAVVFVLGIIFSILALVDIVTGRQFADKRYFTRCFSYRLYSLACVILFFYAFLRIAQGGDPAHSGDVFRIGFPGTFLMFFVLSITNSLHVISGLVASRKQEMIRGGEYTLYLVSQFIIGFGFLGSLSLSTRENRLYPNERADFFAYAFRKRKLPIPEVFGMLLGFGVLFSLWMLYTFYKEGIASFMLILRSYYPGDAYRVMNTTVAFYLVLIAVILCAVTDAIRFSRKPPEGFPDRRFLRKLSLYSMAALVLEITLLALILIIVGSFFTHYNMFISRDRADVIPRYLVFLAINIAVIVATQASASLYMRLVIKRSLAVGMISEETAADLGKKSMNPLAQFTVSEQLLLALREQEEKILGSRVEDRFHPWF